MKKRLTEAQFHQSIKGLDAGVKTLEIARGVLVDGKPQTDFVQSMRLTKGAISQAVNRVWTAYEEKNLPSGYERVSAVLSKHKAFIVKKWNEETTIKLEQKK